MTIWATIVAVIQLGIKLLDMWLERDKTRREAKKEALNEVKEGIKRRDASAVTRGFDRASRI